MHAEISALDEGSTERKIFCTDQLVDWLFWLRFFIVFFSPSRQLVGKYLPLGHNCFLSISPIINDTTQSELLTSLNKPQINKFPYNKKAWYGHKLNTCLRCTMTVNSIFSSSLLWWYGYLLWQIQHSHHEHQISSTLRGKAVKLNWHTVHKNSIL